MYRYSSGRDRYLERTSPKEKQTYWQEEIKSIGPEAAYADMKAEAMKVSPGLRHAEAHYFGAALYQEFGDKALSYCGLDFASGCLHEAFKWIIAEHGPEGIASLEKGCDTDPVRAHQCQHAIGHGLFGYFGYEKQSLRKALDVCKRNFYEDPINGCVGGVFMEYNMYTSLGPDIQVRAPDKSGWYGECPTLSSDFKQACYAWLPQWWRVYMLSQKISEEAIFTKMGELCGHAPDPSYRNDCIERVGQHAAYAGKYDVGKTLGFCKLASHSALDMLSCRSYAAFIFTYNDSSLKDRAHLLCDGLSSHDDAYCRAFADNKASKQQPLPIPQEESFVPLL